MARANAWCNPKVPNRVLGTLRSGHPAAYMGLLVRGISPVTIGLDRIGRRWLPGNSPAHPSRLRCVFITCPSRSGGTLVYQALTRVLPCVYLTNAHHLCPAFGSRLMRAGQSKLNTCRSFKNYYGYTARLYDVSEGNEFLSRLFQQRGDVDWAGQQESLRAEFLRLIGLLSPGNSECVIFKNVGVYSAVADLHRAVPEIIFVRVRRDREQLIQSVLRAYHDLGYFNQVPDSLLEREFDDPVEFAAALVTEIENRIDQQFAQLPPSAKLEISYESFCQDPGHFIRRLGYDMLQLPPGSLRDCPGLEDLKPSRRPKVSEAEKLKIRAILETQSEEDGVSGA